MACRRAGQKGSDPSKGPAVSAGFWRAGLTQATPACRSASSITAVIGSCGGNNTAADLSREIDPGVLGSRAHILTEDLVSPNNTQNGIAIPGEDRCCKNT